jgi:hypothetical protein
MWLGEAGIDPTEEQVAIIQAFFETEQMVCYLADHFPHALDFIPLKPGASPIESAAACDFRNVRRRREGRPPEPDWRLPAIIADTGAETLG